MIFFERELTVDSLSNSEKKDCILDSKETDTLEKLGCRKGSLGSNEEKKDCTSEMMVSTC